MFTITWNKVECAISNTNRLLNLKFQSSFKVCDLVKVSTLWIRIWQASNKIRLRIWCINWINTFKLSVQLADNKKMKKLPGKISNAYSWLSSYSLLFTIYVVENENMRNSYEKSFDALNKYRKGYNNSSKV